MVRSNKHRPHRPARACSQPLAVCRAHSGVRRRILKKSPDPTGVFRTRIITANSTASRAVRRKPSGATALSLADLRATANGRSKKKTYEVDPFFIELSSIPLVVDDVRCRVPFEQRVVYRSPNPKQAGSAAGGRYSAYMGAETVGDALKLGCCVQDFAFDFKKAYLQFPNLETKAIQLEQVEPQRRAIAMQLGANHKRAQAAKARGKLRAEQQREELAQTLKVKQLVIDLTDSSATEARSATETPLPHLSCEAPVPYHVVVLSYPHAKRIDCLRTRTLAFLRRQQVLWSRVHLVVATEAERALYAASLGKFAPDILVVGAPGVVRARNWVVDHFDDGTHILSLDDDIQEVHIGGDRHGTPLPGGGLASIVRHADRLMMAQGAFMWGLNVSDNELNSRTEICRRNGLVNGHFYGYLNRPHLRELMPCLGEAAEDCERSLRYFVHDQVVLRYCMYSASTKTFLMWGGLQSLFGDLVARKEAENVHIERLQDACPSLIRFEPKSKMETVNASFCRVGLPPLRPDGFGGWA